MTTPTWRAGTYRSGCAAPGVHTIGDLAQVALPDLTDWFDHAHGRGPYRLARADDDRLIVADRLRIA